MGIIGIILLVLSEDYTKKMTYGIILTALSELGLVIIIIYLLVTINSVFKSLL